MFRPLLYLFLFSFLGSGCKKFLDAKADSSQFVVSKMSELQGLYDLEINYTTFPVSGLLASDDGYFTNANFNSLPLVERNVYLWEQNTDLAIDWDNCYQKIFRMNTIIEEFEKLSTPGLPLESKQILGSALFSRAINHFEIAQLFAPNYDSKLAGSTSGIPLKLTPDSEAKTTRSTLEITYKTIIQDLTRSVGLLPDTGLFKTRPSKCAAYGMLARINLQMGNYLAAENYADSSLAISSRLINFNDSSIVGYTASASFGIFNPEVIYHASSWSTSAVNTFYADTVLIASYHPDDLRMTTFFARIGPGAYRFKGGYNGPRTTAGFSGISTNELLLIRAESRARNNKTGGAMSDLNTLLSRRWKRNKYVEKSAADPVQALDMILIERRKELCFRPTITWGDLRRLNMDPKFRRTLTRKLNGSILQLLPEDKRYTFLIPSRVFTMNDMEQNPR